MLMGRPTTGNKGSSTSKVPINGLLFSGETFLMRYLPLDSMADMLVWKELSMRDAVYIQVQCPIEFRNGMARQSVFRDSVLAKRLGHESYVICRLQDHEDVYLTPQCVMECQDVMQRA